MATAPPRLALALVLLAAAPPGADGLPTSLGWSANGTLVVCPARGQRLVTEPPLDADEWPPPIIGDTADSIIQQLNDPAWQWLSAVVAAILGLVLLVDGEFACRWLIVAAIVIFASAMVRDSPEGHLPDSLWHHVVRLEAGVLSACTAIMGMEGLMVLAGACVGVAVAMGAEGACAVRLPLLEEQWARVAFYTLFAAAFTALFQGKSREIAFAVVCPALGAALVTASLLFGVTALAARGLAGRIAGFHPVQGCWVTFMCSLWAPGGEDDVGLFAGSPRRIDGLSPDLCCGYLLWALLFAKGALSQLRADCKRRAAARKARDIANAELKQSLLGGGARAESQVF